MSAFKILIMALIISLRCSCLFADNSQFQVRLALDEKEAQTIFHDILPYTLPRGEEIEIAVGRDIVLSIHDVQDASIRLQEDLLKDLPDWYWTMGSDSL